jgi:DNA-binding XRE family transcriptional regulator
MANKFSDLRSKMKPEAQKRAASMAQTMLAEMPLNELRQARGLSQKMLAEVLQVQQPSIAKIEKRTEKKYERKAKKVFFFNFSITLKLC